MPRKYVYGTPGPDAWGYWKRNHSDSRMQHCEYERAYESLNRWLCDFCINENIETWTWYVRGDNLDGKREQHLLVVDPRILSVKLLDSIQNWLATFGKRRWRVAVISLSPILVYPEVIRLESNYRSWAISKALNHIRMRDLKSSTTRRLIRSYRKRYFENLLMRKEDRFSPKRG